MEWVPCKEGANVFLAEPGSQDDKSDFLWPEYALGPILRPL
jgi:hypothetical protein